MGEYQREELQESMGFDLIVTNGIIVSTKSCYSCFNVIIVWLCLSGIL